MYINFIPIRPKTEFIDLLDTLWYIFVKEDDIDFVIFCRIFKSKEVNARIIFEKLFYIFFLKLTELSFPLKNQQVLGKLFALIDTDKAGAGQVSVNQVMASITEYTSERLVHS